MWIRTNKTSRERSTYLQKASGYHRTHLWHCKKDSGGFTMCTKRGIKRASSDVGLMFTALNLRRLMSILVKNVFKKFLRELALLFFAKTGSVQLLLASTRPLTLLLCFNQAKIKGAA
jgi:hypothetical protein